MNDLQQNLLNDFQRDFPLTATPYAEVAQRLGVTEEQVLEVLRNLAEEGTVSRVGPVFQPGKIGTSTLAAMAIEPSRLEEVAALVNDYPEVNHNYERENYLNLWFVITASSKEHLQAVLRDIEESAGITVISLPMITEYHIDLGFNLR
jgi:DNA-binding Lrp family transcriptional regulator